MGKIMFSCIIKNRDTGEHHPIAAFDTGGSYCEMEVCTPLDISDNCMGGTIVGECWSDKDGFRVGLYPQYWTPESGWEMINFK